MRKRYDTAAENFSMHCNFIQTHSAEIITRNGMRIQIGIIIIIISPFIHEVHLFLSIKLNPNAKANPNLITVKL